MDERLKRRLVGAAVLVSLIVIFVPMLLEDRSEPPMSIEPEAMPDSAMREDGFVSSKVLPPERERLSEPPQPAAEVSIAAPDAESEPEPESALPAEKPATVEPLLQAPPSVVHTQAGAPVPEPSRQPEAKVQPRTSKQSAEPASTAPAVPGRAASPRAWVVQVGSFASERNAAKLVEELKAARFSAFREDARVGGRTVYRVRVGPEIDRKRAEAMASGIGKRFKLKCQVVRYP